MSKFLHDTDDDTDDDDAAKAIAIPETVELKIKLFFPTLCLTLSLTPLLLED